MKCSSMQYGKAENREKIFNFAGVSVWTASGWQNIRWEGCVWAEILKFCFARAAWESTFGNQSSISLELRKTTEKPWSICLMLGSSGSILTSSQQSAVEVASSCTYNYFILRTCWCVLHWLLCLILLVNNEEFHWQTSMAAIRLETFKLLETFVAHSIANREIYSIPISSYLFLLIYII